MPAVERSPTSNKKPDQETMDTQTGLVNETASYPSGKLSAVTRKANEIKEVLNTELPDRNWVKTHLSIYKERVSNFTLACMALENQEGYVNNTAFKEWFYSHEDKMDLFMYNVKNWIRRSRCNNSQTSSVTLLQAKLTKERAKLEAIEAVRIQEEILERKKAEERARRKEQEAQAQMSAEKLEQESRNLAAAKQRIFVQALEKQAKKLQMINDYERNNLAIQLKELDEGGLVQNPYFDSIFARSNQEANKLKEELNLNPMAASFKMNVPALPIQDQGLPNELARDNREKNLSALQMNQSLSKDDMVTVLMRSQQRAFLPKCKPNCFDGLNSTHFHEFMYSFKSMIADKCDSDIDRFAYLSCYTSGLALQIVNSCRTLKDPSANYCAKLTGLENEFGNEFKISNSYFERLNHWLQVKNEDGLALQQFSIFFTGTNDQMLNFSLMNRINSPAEMRRIINELPYKLRERWRCFVRDNIDRGKVDLEPDDPELCRDKKKLRTSCSTVTPTERLLESSSDWFKLKVRVSWMRRFFRWIINKQIALGPLTTEEMDGSLRSIWSYVVQQEFPDVIEEFRRLKTSNDSKKLCHILKKENLLKLHPFYDGQLLRVGGRISRVDVPDETKLPIMLPIVHSTVRIFVRDVHFKMGHLVKVKSGLLSKLPLKMDDEGLYTLFCEVEAILNGRPLTAMSDDPSDMNALTPNHLLLARPGPAFPPGIFTSDDCYTRRRWRQIQYLADLFWKRWKVEYLPLLQSRLKWEQPKKSLEVGDLVLLVDNLSPRNHWNMGHVIKTNPDDKGHVRFADLKVPNSATEVRRPISKLIPLNLKFETA